MKIRELLTDETKWTQGQAARTITGEATSATGESAVRWCLLGAIMKCYGHSYSVQLDVELLLRSTVNGIVTYNDDPNREFEEVKALVEKLDI